VSHDDAVNYTRWLSGKAGGAYRLPTEAEWEWAGRGGNGSTARDYFWTGATVPSSMQNNQKPTGIPKVGLPLGVARFQANPLGLYDTIGNVEEWCADWYGPYPAAAAANPVGPAAGTFRVTRGGSHSTPLYYLRSANRAGALPEERSWYIGFRVVLAAVSASAAPDNSAAWSSIAPVGEQSQQQQQQRREWEQQQQIQQIPHSQSRVSTDEAHNPRPTSNGSWPTWSTIPVPPVVRRYVNIPASGATQLPFNIHNHEPTIAACPNGDVTASWFSTNCGEPGRCTGLVSARLTNGSSLWTTAAVQLDAPDRCELCRLCAR